jgi:hypothetical protein
MEYTLAQLDSARVMLIRPRSGTAMSDTCSLRLFFDGAADRFALHCASNNFMLDFTCLHTVKLHVNVAIIDTIISIKRRALRRL